MIKSPSKDKGKMLIICYRSAEGWGAVMASQLLVSSEVEHQVVRWLVVSKSHRMNTTTPSR